MDFSDQLTTARKTYLHNHHRCLLNIRTLNNRSIDAAQNNMECRIHPYREIDNPYRNYNFGYFLGCGLNVSVEKFNNKNGIQIREKMKFSVFYIWFSISLFASNYTSEPFSFANLLTYRFLQGLSFSVTIVYFLGQ
jgi:hypothetical protein